MQLGDQGICEPTCERGVPGGRVHAFGRHGRRPYVQARLRREGLPVVDRGEGARAGPVWAEEVRFSASTAEGGAITLPLAKPALSSSVLPPARCPRLSRRVFVRAAALSPSGERLPLRLVHRELHPDRLELRRAARARFVARPRAVLFAPDHLDDALPVARGLAATECVCSASSRSYASVLGLVTSTMTAGFRTAWRSSGSSSGFPQITDASG